MMTELLQGSLSMRTLPGDALTIEGLKDVHHKALLTGIPTNAEIVGIDFALEQRAENSRQIITIRWRITEPQNAPMAFPMSSLTTAPASNPQFQEYGQEPHGNPG